MNSKQAVQMINEFEGVTMKDHFGGDAFSANKRIFVTVWHAENRANFRLSLAQQKKFLISDEEGFSAMNNAWGKKGWTSAHLQYLDKKAFAEVLRTAWEYSAVKDTKKISSKKT